MLVQYYYRRKNFNTTIKSAWGRILMSVARIGMFFLIGNAFSDVGIPIGMGAHELVCDSDLWRTYELRR